MSRSTNQTVARLKGTGRQREFLPLIADAFVEFGFRRTTTAELAQRCGVRENELYRIWASKKAMFLAALDYVYSISVEHWQAEIVANGQHTAAEQLLARQSRSRGESRLHRIVFSGLSEIDDPDIRAALGNHYRRFHKQLAEYIRGHRQQRSISESSIDAEQIAWAIIGMASIFDIQHDLDLGSMKERRELLRKVSGALINIE